MPDPKTADKDARQTLRLAIRALNSPQKEQAVEEIKQLLPIVADLNQPYE